MEREYDIFEQFPDGFPVWRGHVSSLQDASLKLQQLARATANECFAVHLPTREVVASVNVRGGKPVVFQVTYDDAASSERAKLLRLHGYEVITVFGNEAAKLVLKSPQECDFFIVGHAAAEDVRAEMVAWLKEKYPDTPVLAMNAPGIGPLARADFNAKVNGPETWVAVIATALGRGRPSGPSVFG